MVFKQESKNQKLLYFLEQANTDSSKMAEAICISEVQFRFVVNTSSEIGPIKCASVVNSV